MELLNIEYRALSSLSYPNYHSTVFYLVSYNTYNNSVLKTKNILFNSNI